MGDHCTPTGTAKTVTVLVPGDVTVIVMFPLDPGVVPAVSVTGKVSPAAAGLPDVGAPLRQPIVHEVPVPPIEPMLESAVTVMWYQRPSDCCCCPARCT